MPASPYLMATYKQLIKTFVLDRNASSSNDEQLKNIFMHIASHPSTVGLVLVEKGRATDIIYPGSGKAYDAVTR